MVWKLVCAFCVCGFFWGGFLASRHGTVGGHVACRLMLAIRSCPRLTGIFTHTPPLTIHHHPPLPTTIHYPHRVPIPTTTTTTKTSTHPFTHPFASSGPGPVRADWGLADPVRQLRHHVWNSIPRLFQLYTTAHAPRYIPIPPHTPRYMRGPF